MKPLIIILFCLTTISFADKNNKRTDAADTSRIVNVASSDTTIPIRMHNRIRAINADVGGIVKLWIRADEDTITEVRVLNDAQWYPKSNVIKVFPLYNGTDSTTCQVYNSSGVLVRGIRLEF